MGGVPATTPASGKRAGWRSRTRHPHARRNKSSSASLAAAAYPLHAREEVRMEELEAVGAADDAARFRIDPSGESGTVEVSEGARCPLGLPLLQACLIPAGFWMIGACPTDY